MTNCLFIFFYFWFWFIAIKKYEEIPRIPRVINWLLFDFGIRAGRPIRDAVLWMLCQNARGHHACLRRRQVQRRSKLYGLLSNLGFLCHFFFVDSKFDSTVRQCYVSWCGNAWFELVVLVRMDKKTTENNDNPQRHGG